MSHRGSHNYKHQPQKSTKQQIAPIGTCHVTGKHCYARKKDAKARRGFMLAMGLDAQDLVPYRCEHCEHYHLGTKRMYGELVSREKHRRLHADPSPAVAS